MSCENHSGPEELAGGVSLNSQREVYCLISERAGQGISWKGASNLGLAFCESKQESWGQNSLMGEAPFSWVSQDFWLGEKGWSGWGWGPGWGPSGPQNKVGCSGIRSAVLGWGHGWWPLGVQTEPGWLDWGSG